MVKARSIAIACALLLAPALHAANLLAHASSPNLPTEQLDNSAFQQFLDQLQEPDLFKEPTYHLPDIYRFTAIPSRKLKTSVRIDVGTNGRITGQLKIVNYDDQYNPVLKRREFEVSELQLARLRSAYDAMYFWNMHAHEGHYDPSGKRTSIPICGDGDYLVLEARTAQGYHGVENGCSRERTERMKVAIEVFKEIARSYTQRGPHDYIQ